MNAEQLSTLVEQAKTQDGEAITQLYEKYHNGVYFLCLKIVKDEDDALDLVQDSFLQAFGKLDTLQNPAQFGSWLNQIAANKCRDYLKKKKPALFSQQKSGDEEGQEKEPEIEDRDENLIPDKALDTEETRRLVMGIIDGLPDLQRMTVMLYYYEEKSVKQIAEIMECSENTVKSRLNYARKQIKEGVLDLEKKGTKLYGVMPMLFPLIRHAAADFTVPSGASASMLGNITSSLSAGSAQGTAGAASAETGHSAASHIAAKASGAMRKAADGFSKLSLPAKIGAGIAAAAVVTGIGLGVSAAVYHSVSAVQVSSANSQAVNSKLSSKTSSAVNSKVSILQNSSASAAASSKVSSSMQVSSGTSSSQAASSNTSGKSVPSADSSKTVLSTADVPITSIQLSRKPVEELPLYIGQKGNLTATVSPSSAAADGVVWSSSDPKIATVDQKGNVKGVGQGQCSITAASAANKKISASVGAWIKPEFEYLVGGDGVSHSGNVVTIQYDKVGIGDSCNGTLRLNRFKTYCCLSDVPNAFTCDSCETSYKLSNTSVIKMKNHGCFVVLGRGTVQVTMSCPESSNSLTVTINVV